MNNDVFQDAERLVADANRVLVATHVQPDGDAFGSLTAVGGWLSLLHKEFDLVVDGGMVPRFDYLPLADRVEGRPDHNDPYDLMIIVDCGDEGRIGKVGQRVSQPTPPILNFDHHVTNTMFGKVNVVSAETSSTCELLFEFFSAIDIEITADIANSLLTGLLTDTRGFRTLNTKARTLEVASDLMKLGADLSTVTQKALTLKPYSMLETFREGLNQMKFEDGLIWTVISKEARKKIGGGTAGSNGLSGMLGDTETAAMGAVITEMDDGRVGCSFRCRPPYDVAAVALKLGGGGHTLAAGATVEGPLAKAEIQIVDALKAGIQKTKAEG